MPSKPKKKRDKAAEVLEELRSKTEPMKISRFHMDRVRELRATVAAGGWLAIGLKRKDPVTAKAIVEAAIDLLHERGLQ